MEFEASSDLPELSLVAKPESVELSLRDIVMLNLTSKYYKAI